MRDLTVLDTIDRYVLRQIAVPFGVGLGLFFVVVLFTQIFRVSDAVTGLGISFQETLKVLVYSLPPLMGLLIPVSALFATLLGMGRMAMDREILGLYAVGFSPYRLLRMPVAVGSVLALLSGVAMVWGGPWGVRGLRQVMARSAQRALTGGVRLGVFHEWVPGITFMAKAAVGHELAHVMVSDQRDEKRPVVISARRGSLHAGNQAQDIVLWLHDGAIFIQDKATQDNRLIYFQTSFYRLNVAHSIQRKGRHVSAIQEMPMSALWRESHDLRLPSEHRALVLVTFHRKLAVALATLVFSLLAVPLACQSRSGARARGLLISTALVGAYYYLGRAAELAARTGSFPPVVAAWLPNMLGLGAGVGLLLRFRRIAGG